MAEEQVRPPYVKFEFRSMEDRDQTVAQGHYVGKDVVFAIVTPTGTRDRVEREAQAWLDNIREGVNQERIPASWLPLYEAALKNFTESRETPENGTPVRDWAAIPASQVTMLLDMNVRTIEDVAAANDETINRIGMGGRALKQKAQAWLDSADTGKVAGELEDLRVQNETLTKRDEQRERELAKLKAQVAALTAKEEA